MEPANTSLGQAAKSERVCVDAHSMQVIIETCMKVNPSVYSVTVRGTVIPLLLVSVGYTDEKMKALVVKFTQTTCVQQKGDGITAAFRRRHQDIQRDITDCVSAKLGGRPPFMLFRLTKNAWDVNAAQSPPLPPAIPKGSAPEILAPAVEETITAEHGVPSSVLTDAPVDSWPQADPAGTPRRSGFGYWIKKYFGKCFGGSSERDVVYMFNPLVEASH